MLGERIRIPRVRRPSTPAEAPAAAVPAPRGPSARLGWAALVLAVTGALGFGASCYLALAGVPLVAVNPLGPFFKWAAVAGAAALLVFLALVVALVSAVRTRRSVVPFLALLTALVLPGLTGWIGISAGLDVLSATLSRQVGERGGVFLQEEVGGFVAAEAERLLAEQLAGAGS
ncbi:hypothetical protein CLV92_10765 [Kineococcus xinjiangensis]|uniref:Uncharacterized protein n=1 Tax=Kineococcus xinjiangensis TaxID=512762 RepID=A0A2S6IK09_9ACTN|nr:hypothetical protein [Kineococcus xinjiangensis]PPK94562.1 hypothetical protein CLV92_10765 [Kineococcus xinjiangensis]